MKKLSLVISLTAIACSYNAQAAQARIIGLDNPNRIHNSYIVVFKDSTGKSVDELASSIANEHKASIKRKYKHAIKGISISVPDQAIKGLSHNPNVAYIEADFNQLDVTSTVSSWGLDRMNQRNLPLNNAYSSSATGTGVHAYIMDSGIRSTHNEFTGRIGNSVDYVNEGSEDCLGHGTHVAGTVGGSTYGVATDVTLHDVKFITCQNTTTLTRVLNGVDWIAANHIQPAVANFSWRFASSSVSNAVTGLINLGVSVVVAGGNNNGDACNQIPASVPTAITVGATEIDDDRSTFSNYGTCLDVFAPGTGITSATNTSNTSSGNKNGTSMAAPHVAGVAALYLEDNPTDTPAQVHTAIVNNATLNKVNNPGTGSPNKLLHSTFGGASTPSVPTGLQVYTDYCYGDNAAMWNASTGTVTRYELWSSNSSSFTYPWLTYSGTSRYINVNNTHKVYVGVRACNNNECSGFSSKALARYYSQCL